jgi:hypothetical protein
VSALYVGVVACYRNGNEPKPKPDPDPAPNTYVTENYYIANQIESDIVVELHSGEVITIGQGERQQVQELDMVYEQGVAAARSMYTVDRAIMKIDEEVVPEEIWLYEHWNEIREDGEDDYHYTLQYTLNVTDELLKTLNGFESNIYVTKNYRIVNQIGADIVVELSAGDKQKTIIRQGEEQRVYQDEEQIKISECRLYDDEGCLITEVLYREDLPVLEAELAIDGKVLPGTIFDPQYWNVDYEKHSETSLFVDYTLIITDELLERIGFETDL